MTYQVTSTRSKALSFRVGKIGHPMAPHPALFVECDPHSRRTHPFATCQVISKLTITLNLRVGKIGHSMASLPFTYVDHIMV
jgi:hypothetical protein